MKATGEKLTTVNTDRDLFARLLIATNARQINLKEVLGTNFPHQWSLKGIFLSSVCKVADVDNSSGFCLLFEGPPTQLLPVNNAQIAFPGLTKCVEWMRATVQMLRIFICFIYIPMDILDDFFFFFVFVIWRKFCLFKMAQDAQTNNDNMQKFIKIQDFSKKISERNIRLHRYSNGYPLTPVIH